MRRSKMELSRRIGIGIVMLVPAFVGSGVLWALFHSWLPIVVWVAIMAVVAGGIMSGRFIKSWESRQFRFG
jgi:membrane protease YdiL (CAAX protease family)